MKKENTTGKKLIAFGIAAGLVSLCLAGCGESSAAKDSGSYATADAAAESAYYDDYEYEEYGMDAPTESMTSENGEPVEVEEGAQSKRKLIRTVNLDVETYDFDTLTGAISNRVNSLGGYIETSSVDGNNNSYNRSASYTLRIPAGKADTFIESIGENSNITHQSESMEDVTLKYVDIQSRKGSLQVEYDRLEELLKDATDIEELIYIENRLSEVRYEIETIEAQLRSYDNLVDYTTIYLYISEVREYTEPEPIDDSVGARIGRGLADAFENISTFLQDLLVFVVVALPYLIVIAILIVLVWLIICGIRKVMRRHREKHPKQPKGMPFPMNVPGPGVYAQPPVNNIPVQNTDTTNNNGQ